MRISLAALTAERAQERVVTGERQSESERNQELNNLTGVDRAGIAACPTRQHVRAQDPLHVFRPSPLPVDVPRHELRGQVGDRMARDTGGGRVLRLDAGCAGEVGAPRINPLAKKLARRGRLFVSRCQTHFGPGPGTLNALAP
jgi:hypothetical protein